MSPENKTKIRLKIGDIFSVPLDDNEHVKYFQYVADDMTQLGSPVIKVFKTIYPINKIPDFTKVINGEVDFYAHTFIKTGIKLNYWDKVAHLSEISIVDVLFRDTNDYGKPQIKVSNDWWVWKINEPQKHVGALIGVHQAAEIGVVINPESMVNRIKTGKYKMVYPDYKV